METKTPPCESITPVKEVKLQIPLRHHVSLQSLKILAGQSVRDSIVKALEKYFEAHPVPHVPGALAFST